MKMEWGRSRNWSALLLVSILFITAGSHAATVTLDYGTIFSDGAVAPDGPAPYATAVFDDAGGTGSVTLTLEVASTVGSATLSQAYFNFDSTLDLSLLSFSFNAGSSTGPDAENGKNGNGIFVGTDAFQSDGDGAYDILFDFPPPPGSGGSKFEAGEVVVYTITSTEAITASSFNFLSAAGGGEGTFLSAVHFQGTGDGDSAWVGAVVPVPPAVWLFGSGLIGLIAIARRKRSG